MAYELIDYNGGLEITGNGTAISRISSSSLATLILTFGIADEGKVFYKTDTNQYCFWNGAAIVNIADAGSSSNTQVIFNDNGVLAGDPQFLWNKTTNLLTVTGAATITGDLTVDTNVLKVDTSTNRVGVNIATPGTPLDVRSTSTEVGIRLIETTTGNSNRVQLGAIAGGGYIDATTSAGSPVLQFRTATNVQATIDSSGNLGLGVTPSAWATNRKALQIAGSAAASLALNGTSNVSELFFNSFINTSANNVYAVNGRAGLISFGSGGYTFGIDSGTQTAGDNCTFTSAMTLDASGRLGIGTAGPSTALTVHAGADGDVGFFRGGSTRQLQIGTSATAGYLNADNASAGLELRINGTARATIDTAGNLILQSSATPATLTVNGQLTLNATSNTNLRFSYRGSDGVTRVANITLA